MRTTLVNTSGVRRYFGYILPHGRELAADEVLTVNGDLRTVLASGAGRYNRGRELDSLNYDVAHNNIEYTVDTTDSSSSA